MMDALCTARSGLVDASARLDKAAREVAAAGEERGSPRNGVPITGATGSPGAGSGDPLEGLIDLMSAEASFKANLVTLRTAAEMARSLYEVID